VDSRHPQAAVQHGGNAGKEATGGWDLPEHWGISQLIVVGLDVAVEACAPLLVGGRSGKGWDRVLNWEGGGTESFEAGDNKGAVLQVI
jgi:hypothetical protein